MVSARSTAGGLLQAIQLDFALAQGNTTGGTDLICTSGDRILGEDAVAGGNLEFVAGTSSAPASDGGDILLTATASTGAGAGGSLTLTAGASDSGAGGDISLVPGGSTSGTAGLLALGGSGTLQLAGRSSTLGTPAAGNGRLWVSSAASPSTLVFTDDTGADTVLGSSGGGESLTATLAIGNTTGGTAIVTADNAGGDANDLVFTGGAHTGASGSSAGGDVFVTGGASDAPTGRGGYARLQAGAGTGGATSGNLEILGATASNSGAADDLIFIRSSTLTNRNGSTIQLGGTTGDILLFGGTATGGNESGSSLTFTGGTGNGTGDGGSLTFTTGVSGLTGNSGSFAFSVGSAGTDGGDFTVDAGDAPEDPGNIIMTAGEHTGANGSIAGGSIQLIAGTGNGLGGGTVIVRAGSASSGTEGNVYIVGASASASVVPQGEINLVGSPSTNLDSSIVSIAQTNGQITLLGGAATGGNANGSPVVLATGAGEGSGDGGNFTFTASPGGATGNGGDFNFTAGSGGATSGNGGNITFTPGFAPSGTRGEFIVSGDVDVSGTVETEGLILDEAATVPEDPNGTTQGMLWVRDDNPNVLVFTDNTGVDTVLGSGGALATVLGVGNTTGGTPIILTTGDAILGETAATAGTLTLTGGTSTGAANGGNVTITSGSVSGGTNENCGDVNILGAVATNANGDGGAINLTGGASTAGNSGGGNVNITGGNAVGTTGQGGGITLTTGDSTGASSCAPLALVGGSTPSQRGSDITATAGDGERGGDISLKGGTQIDTGGSSQAGEIVIESGDVDGGLASGTFGGILINVPNPAVNTDNRVGGSITISAGDTGQNNASGGAVNISAGHTNGFSASGGFVNITAGDEQGNAGSPFQGGDVAVTPGASAGSGFEGVLDVLGSSTIELHERAAGVTTPLNAGEGRIWLRDDTPNTLMFTDDAGTDFAIAGAGVVSLSNFSDVLAAGSDTGGNPITTADDAVAAPNNLRMDAGSHTGAVAGQDGSSIILTAGDSNSATGDGGSVLISAGDATAGGSDGDIQLNTLDYQTPVRVLTDATSESYTALRLLTHNETISLPLFAVNQTVLTLETLTFNGQNLQVDIRAMAHDSNDFDNFASLDVCQSFFRNASGTVVALTAHRNDLQASGGYSGINGVTLELAVSGTSIILRANYAATSGSATDANITVNGRVQLGGES